MSFVKKVWEDRISEYPTRRKIIDVDTGDESIVDVERAEGEVVNAGTALSADNFNDLEERVFGAFDEMNKNFSTAANDIGDALVALGVEVPDGTPLSSMASLIANNLVMKVSANTFISLASSEYKEASEFTFSMSVSSQTSGQTAFSVSSGKLKVNNQCKVKVDFSVTADVYGTSNPGDASATLYVKRVRGGTTSDVATKTGSYNWTAYSTISGSATLDALADDLYYVYVSTNKKCRFKGAALKFEVV